MTETRIYVVTNKNDNGRRLVEAASAAQAIRHCVSSIYEANVATAKSIAQYMGDGLKIEKAELAIIRRTSTTKTAIEQQATN